MFKKPLGLLGVYLVVVGFGFFAGAGVACTEVQDGYGSLQSFSEAQNAELTYDEDGQLIDRGTAIAYHTLNGTQTVQLTPADFTDSDGVVANELTCSWRSASQHCWKASASSSS